MFYNDTNIYSDIYNLDVGESPNLDFIYFDSMWGDYPIPLTTTMTYDNLDTSTAGYYYREYHATNGSNYVLDFRTIF